MFHAAVWSQSKCAVLVLSRSHTWSLSYTTRFLGPTGQSHHTPLQYLTDLQSLEQCQLIKHAVGQACEVVMLQIPLREGEQNNSINNAMLMVHLCRENDTHD